MKQEKDTATYDVFISYRRKTGVNDARLLQQALRTRGYSVFFDFDSLRDGKFDARILRAIDEATVFILMMTENSLDGCSVEGDWVRLEIEHAIKTGKKIVPVKPSDQCFEFPDSLPQEVGCLKNEQFSELNKGALFEESIDKIIRDRFPQSVKRKPKNRKALLPAAIAIALLLPAFLLVLPTWWNNDVSEHGNTVEKSSKRIVEANDQVEGNSNEIRGGKELKGKEPPLFILDYKGDVGGVVLKGDTDIAIPEGVRRINICAFTNCAITSVKLPDSLEEIGYKAFEGCHLLTNVTFGVGLKRMSTCVFANCKALSGVFELPEGLESLDRAFVFCNSGITDMVLPSTLRKMEMQEFIGCSRNLTRVWFKGNAPEIPGVPASGKYKYNQAPLYGAPQDLVVLVPKNSTGWKDDSADLPYLWPTNPAFKPGARKIANYTAHPPAGTSGTVSHKSDNKAPLSQQPQRRPVPPNNDYSSPKELVGAVGRETTSNRDATSNSGEFLDGIFGSEHTLWYRWVAPSSGIVSFDTSGSDFDTVIGALECVDNSGAARSRASNDDAEEGATLTSRIVFKVESGKEYRISVGGKLGACGQQVLNWKYQTDSPIFEVDKAGVLRSVVLNGFTDIVIPKRVKSIGNNAFNGLKVTSVKIPASLETIGVYAFKECVSLTNVTFSSGSRLRLVDKWAFCFCRSLTGVFELPEGVEAVNFGAFMGSGVNTLVFPSSLASIGAQQTVFNTPLHHVYFKGNAPKLTGSIDSGDSPYNGAQTTLVTHVRPGTAGWNGDVNGLPSQWPDKNGRAIQYYTGSTPQGTSGIVEM